MQLSKSPIKRKRAEADPLIASKKVKNGSGPCLRDSLPPKIVVKQSTTKTDSIDINKQNVSVVDTNTNKSGFGKKVKKKPGRKERERAGRKAKEQVGQKVKEIAAPKVKVKAKAKGRKVKKANDGETVQRGQGVSRSVGTSGRHQLVLELMAAADSLNSDTKLANASLQLKYDRISELVLQLHAIDSSGGGSDDCGAVVANVAQLVVGAQRGRQVYQLLSPSCTTHRVRSALRVLSVLCTCGVGGGDGNNNNNNDDQQQAAAIVLTGVNLSRGQLPQLAVVRSRVRQDDVRAAFVTLVLSLVVGQPASFVCQVLTDRAAPLALLVTTMSGDRAAVIALVLGSLKSAVLENVGVPKRDKLRLFNARRCGPLLQLYNWRGHCLTWRFNSKFKKHRHRHQQQQGAEAGDTADGDESDVGAVRQCVHQFLLLVFTSRRDGIVFADNTLGSGGGAGGGGGAVCCNQVLLDMLVALPCPWRDQLVGQLVISTLVAAPDLIQPYWDWLATHLVAPHSGGGGRGRTGRSHVLPSGGSGEGGGGGANDWCQLLQFVGSIVETLPDFRSSLDDYETQTKTKTTTTTGTRGADVSLLSSSFPSEPASVAGATKAGAAGTVVAWCHLSWSQLVSPALACYFPPCLRRVLTQALTSAHCDAATTTSSSSSGSSSCWTLKQRVAAAELLAAIATRLARWWCQLPEHVALDDLEEQQQLAQLLPTPRDLLLVVDEVPLDSAALLTAESCPTAASAAATEQRRDWLHLVLQCGRLTAACCRINSAAWRHDRQTLASRLLSASGHQLQQLAPPPSAASAATDGGGATVSQQLVTLFTAVGLAAAVASTSSSAGADAAAAAGGGCDGSEDSHSDNRDRVDRIMVDIMCDVTNESSLQQQQPPTNATVGCAAAATATTAATVVSKQSRAKKSNNNSNNDRQKQLHQQPVTSSLRDYLLVCQTALATSPVDTDSLARLQHTALQPTSTISTPSSSTITTSSSSSSGDKLSQSEDDAIDCATVLRQLVQHALRTSRAAHAAAALHHLATLLPPLVQCCQCNNNNHQQQQPLAVWRVSVQLVTEWLFAESGLTERLLKPEDDDDCDSDSDIGGGGSSSCAAGGAGGSVKERLVRVLIALVAVCRRHVCKSSHVALYLAAYGASLSRCDQLLLQLIGMYERHDDGGGGGGGGCSLHQYRPTVWGPTAAAAHYRPSRGGGVTHVRRATPADIVSLLQPDRLYATCARLPLNLSLTVAVAGAEAGDVPAGHIVEVENGQQCYDPRFLLALLLQLTAPTASSGGGGQTAVEPVALLQTGVASLLVCVLACRQMALRAAAATVLARLHTLLLHSRRQRYSALWLTVIELLRASVVEFSSHHSKQHKQQQQHKQRDPDSTETGTLPSAAAVTTSQSSSSPQCPLAPLPFISAFLWSRLLHVLTEPGHRLYSIVCRHLLRCSRAGSLQLARPPLFFELFNGRQPGSVQWHQHWLLDTLTLGLRSQHDLAAVQRCAGFKLVLAAVAGGAGGGATRSRLLHLVETVVRVPLVLWRLEQQMALTVWLSGEVNSGAICVASLQSLAQALVASVQQLAVIKRQSRRAPSSHDGGSSRHHHQQQQQLLTLCMGTVTFLARVRRRLGASHSFHCQLAQLLRQMHALVDSLHDNNVKTLSRPPPAED